MPHPGAVGESAGDSAVFRYGQRVPCQREPGLPTIQRATGWGCSNGARFSCHSIRVDSRCRDLLGPAGQWQWWEPAALGWSRCHEALWPWSSA